jgi:cellulose synthase/poly-beta-1,6-N-acetylglucosamine synthase-like glycosyltransferase
VIVTLLTVSALAYLLARLGFFYRTRTHHRAARAALDKYFDVRRPALTTIIPSYQEDERVIRTTLLSAALQEYPDKRVVLLIDDPYVPKTRAARRQLESARALPGKIELLLAGPATTLTPAYQFQSTSANPGRQSVLGFVVAASSSACTPSWGGAYTLAAAGQTLSMSARIAQLQQEGARAIVSFGGQANTSLDVACPTSAALAAAYQSVISAYSLTTSTWTSRGPR